MTLGLLRSSSAGASVGILGENWLIDGLITYPNAVDQSVRGLLLNARLIQGIFDDHNVGFMTNS